MAFRIPTNHRPIWTPRRKGEPRVAEHVEKAQGWGPLGMWDMEERRRALGPSPASIEGWNEQQERDRRYLLNLAQRRRNWMAPE